MAVEVEVSVVGEVNHGGGIGGGGVVDGEGVGVVPGVDDGDFEVAGIAGVAIGGVVTEHYFVVGYGFAGPDVVLEAVGAAVERVGAVVDGELVGGAVDGELAVGDAVGISTGGFTCTRTVAEVGFGVVVAEHHVGECAVGFGEFYGNYACSERREHYLCAVVVSYCKPCNFSFGGWECLSGKFHDI